MRLTTRLLLRVHAIAASLDHAPPTLRTRWRLWSIYLLVGCALHRRHAAHVPDSDPLSPVLLACMSLFPRVWPQAYLSGAGLGWQQSLAALTWRRRVLAGAARCGATSRPRCAMAARAG